MTDEMSKVPDGDPTVMAMRLFGSLDDAGQGRFLRMAEVSGIDPDEWTGDAQLVVAELARRPLHFTDRVEVLFELVRAASFRAGWRAHGDACRGLEPVSVSA